MLLIFSYDVFLLVYTSKMMATAKVITFLIGIWKWCRVVQGKGQKGIRSFTSSLFKYNCYVYTHPAFNQLHTSDIQITSIIRCR